MNYNNYVKVQIKNYIEMLIVVGLSFTSVTQYLGYREVVVLNVLNVATFWSATFTYIFILPLYHMQIDALYK